MMSRGDLALVVASGPMVAASAYLATLALAARRVNAPAGMRGLAFDVIVPAHNEERVVETTLSSLRALEYPPNKYRLVVVADNCDDGTADRARAAGAIVWERHEPERQGKGYALAFAFATSLADGWADAVVVVDADSIASSNLLSAFAARFIAGADCVQADYGVQNAGSSWRTRLTRIAFALYHTVRSLGRERLGLSCGLRGNGMGFTTEVLRRVPYAAFSLVEDVEYGLVLGVAGVRVVYAQDAIVLGDMPASGDAARVQRQRWEMGRRGLLRQYVPTLLRTAVMQRSAIALDLAADVLVPPLTTLTAASLAGTVMAAALWWLGVAGPLGFAGWAVSDVALMTYVCRGCALARTGSRTVADLLWAPLYAAWKVTLLARPPRRRGWVRTRREGER